MGKRKYYCDYCDRSFNDDKGARSRHLKSAIHLRNRQIYYSSINDIDSKNLKDTCSVPRKDEVSHSLPNYLHFLHYFGLIPPSLQPFYLRDYVNVNVQCWGDSE